MPKVDVVHDAKHGVGYVGALRRKGNTVWAVGGVWGTPLVMTSHGGAVFRHRQAPPASGLRDVLLQGDQHALIVGEHGGLYETKDAETWRQIETGTTGCLFALERAHGSVWLAGDNAFVMSSADGITWRKPKLGESIKKLGRIQRLRHAAGKLWFLGYEGKLGVLEKDRVELAPVESNRPITAIAFTPRGVGVVVGDGGTVFRTTNRGRDWERVEVGVAHDLEDVAWSADDGHFVIVGAKGTLLVSADGQSFEPIATKRDEHLWSVMPAASGLLVGGDDGLILSASLDREQLAPRASVQRVEPEGGDVVAQDDIARASKRWIEEGERYYAERRAFVAQRYDASLPRIDEEPKETRRDLAKLVQRIAVELNAANRTEELRRLFPPSFEVFDGDETGQSVDLALYVDDGSVLARVDGTVRRITGDRVETVAGATAFGRSHDRKHYALAFEGRIEVRPGIDRAAHTTIDTPKTLGAIKTIDVFPGGERLVIASESGVWLLSARAADAIHGGDASHTSTHAALSPDGRFIACGSEDSAHRIFIAEESAFALAAEIESLASHSHHAVFHDTERHVCLSACHASRSISLGLGIDALDTREAPKRRKVLRLLDGGGHERLTVIDDSHWVDSGIPREDGYLLGDHDGYAWHVAFDGRLLGYLHIGGAMQAMDASAQGTRLLFGTAAGFLVEYDRTSDEPDPYKVRSAGPGRELRRWVFWRGSPPLVW